MKLDSVRALKEELLGHPRRLTESVESTISFRVFSARRALAQHALDQVSLGVSIQPGKGFRLAVRLPHRSPFLGGIVDQISKQARGEVDVREVGRLIKFNGPAYYQQRRRPLEIGSSISDTPYVSAGTLGCFVVGRKAPHYISLLTNNHVIADENRNKTNSPVVQPGRLDRGHNPRDVVAGLGRFVRLRAKRVNRIDAALADLYEASEYDPRRIGQLGTLQGVGGVSALQTGAPVYKVGRTTGRTEGRITAFEVDNVLVQFDMGVLRFDQQIEIEGGGKSAFSDSGDSGSLIVDSELRAVGLLFAGGSVGGSNGKGLTYANPIQTVLDELNVDLLLD